MFRSVLLRFVLPLALASCVVAFLGLPYIQKLLAEWFSADVEVRAQLVMHTVEAPGCRARGAGQRSEAAQLSREDDRGRAAARRLDMPAGRHHHRAQRARAAQHQLRAAGQDEAVLRRASFSFLPARWSFRASTTTRGSRCPYRVMMLSDLSFVDRRQRTARDFVLVFLGIAVLLLALLVVLVAWLQLRRLVNVLIGDIRGKRFLDDAKLAARLAADPVAGAAGARGGRGEAAARDRLPRELDAAGAAASRARALALLAGDHRLEPRALHP